MAAALGEPADGAWVTERAAAGVLRGAAAGWPDVRLESVRIGLADPDGPAGRAGVPSRGHRRSVSDRP
jgi:hypothetical protein